MPNTLTIYKRTSKSFIHRHNGLPATDYSISDFEVTLGDGQLGDDQKFKIVEKDGASRYVYDVTAVTVIDQTNGGAEYIFNTAIQLEDRLRELNYTPYVGREMPTLQQVTTAGATTSNAITIQTVTGKIVLDSFYIGIYDNVGNLCFKIDLTNVPDGFGSALVKIGNSQGFFSNINSELLTGNRQQQLEDADGTIEII